MSIKMPTYDTLFNPTLRALHELGRSATLTELLERIITDLKLPTEIVEKPHPGGSSKSELEYRFAWARTYLKKYGVITNSSRGVWALTPKGSNIKNVEPKVVVRFVQDARKAEPAVGAANGPHDPAAEDDEVQPSIWKDHVLSIIQQMDSGAFERLAQRVLRESGFVQVEVMGRTGDGGIDGYGILRLAGVLSFRVAFQCKRYRGTNISSSIIRDFRGAMIGRAEKGLLVTTSGFTRDAREEAVRDGAPPIDLVDGNQLAQMLKEYNLGVTTRQIVSEDVEVIPEWFSQI